jgi:hypothetical protein
MVPSAVNNTMDYIFDVLRHPCYMMGIKGERIFFYKLQPGGGTAPSILHTLEKSLKTLGQNPLINDKQMQEIKKSVDVNSTRIMQCIVKSFIEKPEKENEYYTLFKNAGLATKVGNGVFILNLTDATILRADGNLPFPFVYGLKPMPAEIWNGGRGPFLPIMGAGQLGYLDIPIPNYDEVIRVVDWIAKGMPSASASAVGRGAEFVNLAGYETDWNKKERRAIFRGGPSGCGATDDTNMRIKLGMIAKTNPVIDACIVGRGERVIKYDPKYGLTKIDQRALDPVLCEDQRGTPMAVQSKCKYIIHIDGNTNAYRLLGTMLTGSLILRVKSPYVHWADHLLKPGVHYIEISEDLSNLNAVLEWCKTHDSRCRTIAHAGRNIATKLISPDFIFELFVDYMRALNARQLFTPSSPTTPPPSAPSPTPTPAPSLSISPASERWPISPTTPPPFMTEYKYNIRNVGPNNISSEELPTVNQYKRRLFTPTPTPPPSTTLVIKKRRTRKRVPLPMVEEPEPVVVVAQPELDTLPMPSSNRCPKGYNRGTNAAGVLVCKKKGETAVPVPVAVPSPKMANEIENAVKQVVNEVIAENINENNENNEMNGNDDDTIPLRGKRCPAGYGAIVINGEKRCKRKRPVGGGGGGNRTRKISRANGGSGAANIHEIHEKENGKTVRDKKTAIQIAMQFV